MKMIPAVDDHEGKVAVRPQAPLFLTNGMPTCDVCALRRRCPDYEPGAEDCPLFSRILEDRVRRYLRLQHLRDEDVDLVLLYCKNLTEIDFINACASTLLTFQKKRAEMLRYRTQLEGVALRLARDLCLTPAARRALEMDRKRSGDEIAVDRLLEERAEAQHGSNDDTPEDGASPGESSPLL